VTKEIDTADRTDKTIAELLRRAEQGDQKVLPIMRKLMKDFPAVAEEAGNLALVVKSALLDASAGDHLFLREAQEQRMRLLTKELAGPNPTRLERLLAERIVLCGLQLHIAEYRSARADSIPITQADYHQRCIDRAQKRYFSAIKTLAQIRKLGLPALQVNIAAEGGKQVNLQASD